MIKFECDYEIIDAHIHPFEREENSIAPFGAPNTFEEYTAELKRIGTSRACGSFLIKHPCSWAEIRQANRAVLAIRDKDPDFYIPGIHVHGAYPEESAAELKEMHAAGVRWIGELVPYIMGTEAFNTPGMMTIYETARDLGMPVNMHWGTPEEIEPVAKAFPTLNIILAHPGDLGDAVKRVEMIGKYKNLHLDFSGTGLFRWNLLRWTVDRLGSEKVLYGSDFPVCSAGMNLYGALCEHLSHAEFENFFRNNFLRLTGL